MAETTAKLPFMLSLRWSVQWAIAVALRHQLPVAALTAAGVLLGVLAWSAPALVLVGWIVVGIASIALALVTHHEVLRGPAQFDADTLGRSGGRIFSYFLDCLLLGVIIFVVIFIPVMLAILVTSAEQTTDATALWGFVVLIAALVGWVVTSRLALRLPSRAVNETMAWGDVWRLGAGFTLTLTLAPVVLGLPFAIIAGLAELIVSEAFGNLVNWALMPLQVIVTCAFLSVAYGRLRALAAEPALRPQA